MAFSFIKKARVKSAKNDDTEDGSFTAEEAIAARQRGIDRADRLIAEQFAEQLRLESTNAQHSAASAVLPNHNSTASMVIRPPPGLPLRPPAYTEDGKTYVGPAPSIAGESMNLASPGDDDTVEKSISLSYDELENRQNTYYNQISARTKRRAFMGLIISVIILSAVIIAVTLSSEVDADNNDLKCNDLTEIMKLISSVPLIDTPGFNDVLKKELVLNETMLNGASLPCLLEGSFDGRNDLGSIEILTISNVGLKSISANAFPASMEFVSLVTLKDNDLAQVPDTLFDSIGSGISAGIEVRLRNLGKATIGPGIFQNHPNFVVLDIRNSESLTRNMPTLINMEKLVRLFIIDCPTLESIADNAFSELPDLNFLDLTGTSVDVCEEGFLNRTGYPGVSANVAPKISTCV